MPLDASAERRRARRRVQVRRRRLVLAASLAVAALVGILVAVGSGGGHSRAAGSRPSRARARLPVRRPALTAAAPRRRVLRLPSPLPARRLTVPILMYHRIDLLKPSLPAITRSLTVDPADFARQMRWLQASGYHTLTQEQLFAGLEQGAALPARPIVITFDDGYRDVLGKASPVLQHLHMHATAFVITSRISGPDPSFLTWPQLTALERRGIEIGSHTVHHAELPGLSDASAQAELDGSRRALEAHLHHPVQWFAYPAGAFDARSAQLVERAGYVLAVTTRPGSVQDAQAPLELHRYEILDTTGVAGLASMLAR